MTKQWLTGLMLMATAASALGGAIIYHDEASFLGVIEPDYYLEDFSNFTYGSFSGALLNMYGPSGFMYTISAGPHGTLWSTHRAMSVLDPRDPLRVAFTPPVHAIGGNFVPTDSTGYVVQGTVVVRLSDGTVQTLVNPSSTSFLGFLTDVPITSLTIDTPETQPPWTWPQMDHFYVGMPEPSSLVLLGLISLWLRRR